MPRAVLFKSKERFSSFRKTLEDYGIQYTILDFDTHDWIEFDYGQVDFVIYYPSFKYSSNHPMALFEVHDNLAYIGARYPDVQIYPDPRAIVFYNDKYRQYLFLRMHGYPMPQTYPLFSPETLNVAEDRLGFPMVVKNRYGAGGGSVFRIDNRRKLLEYYRLSTLDFVHVGSIRYFLRMLAQRVFYYQLIKKRRMFYPFLSPPLLAQEFVEHDRDLKTVVGNGKVVEAHWRIRPHRDQWKVNIDAGGIGEWSRIPDEAIHLSERLAQTLQTTWINIDILPSNGKFLVTEFSPVWHHYAYREKPSFVYKSDYNIDMPLEVSLNLERIIVDSLVHSPEGYGGRN